MYFQTLGDDTIDTVSSEILGGLSTPTSFGASPLWLAAGGLLALAAVYYLTSKTSQSIHSAQRKRLKRKSRIYSAKMQLAEARAM